jgi:hypothetical protein
VKLWLHDIRPAAEGYVHVHSVNEAIQVMEAETVSVTTSRAAIALGKAWGRITQAALERMAEGDGRLRSSAGVTHLAVHVADEFFGDGLRQSSGELR